MKYSGAVYKTADDDYLVLTEVSSHSSHRMYTCNVTSDLAKATQFPSSHRFTPIRETHFKNPEDDKLFNSLTLTKHIIQVNTVVTLTD